MKEIKILEKDEGFLSINEQVIHSIIQKEIFEIAGIGATTDKNIISKWMYLIQTKTKISFNDQRIERIEIPIRVLYGLNVLSVAKNAQKRISHSLKTFTGIDKIKIDIFVAELIMQE